MSVNLLWVLVVDAGVPGGFTGRVCVESRELNVQNLKVKAQDTRHGCRYMSDDQAPLRTSFDFH